MLVYNSQFPFAFRTINPTTIPTMKFIHTALTFCSLASAVPSAAGPQFYLIRHAEKNSDGTISARGKQREQCLVNLFGKGSKYNIQHIMVQNVHPGNNESQRPYNTTVPLAKNLGIEIDQFCDYNDVSCASDAAFTHYRSSTGNVLIAWEHYYMRRLAAVMTKQDVNNVHPTPSVFSLDRSID